MENKTVLVTATNYSIYCMDAKKLLEENGVTVVENPHDRPMTREELLDVVAGVDGVVAGVDSWDEEIFAQAPRLKAVARFGVGVDNIDLDAAARHGIVVSNAKGMNAGAVAELCVGLILSALRNIPTLRTNTCQGRWDRFVGQELAGMTVGLLGFGDIAQKTTQKLGGFDVNVIAYDLYPNEERARQLGVTMVGMDEVLQQADVVSMHLPSLPETHHVMNDAAFAKMKDGAYFVNTARGALVDEAALYRALATQKLTAAATDVFEQEPAVPQNPLFSLENYIATPHTAAETYVTYQKVGLTTAQALLDVFVGKSPLNRLN